MRFSVLKSEATWLIGRNQKALILLLNMAIRNLKTKEGKALAVLTTFAMALSQVLGLPIRLSNINLYAPMINQLTELDKGGILRGRAFVGAGRGTRPPY